MLGRDREIAALAPKSVGLSDSALCDRQMCGARRQADGAEKSLPRTLDWLPNTSTAPLGPTAHVPCSCQWTNRIIQFCESSNIASYEQIIKRPSPYRTVCVKHPTSV